MQTYGDGQFDAASKPIAVPRGSTHDNFIRSQSSPYRQPANGPIVQANEDDKFKPNSYESTLGMKNSDFAASGYLTRYNSLQQKNQADPDLNTYTPGATYRNSPLQDRMEHASMPRFASGGAFEDDSSDLR